jgi:hypothetical protein
MADLALAMAAASITVATRETQTDSGAGGHLDLDGVGLGDGDSSACCLAAGHDESTPAGACSELRSGIEPRPAGGGQLDPAEL